MHVSTNKNFRTPRTSYIFFLSQTESNTQCSSRKQGATHADMMTTYVAYHDDKQECWSTTHWDKWMKTILLRNAYSWLRRQKSIVRQRPGISLALTMDEQKKRRKKKKKTSNQLAFAFRIPSFQRGRVFRTPFFQRCRLRTSPCCLRWSHQRKQLTFLLRLSSIFSLARLRSCLASQILKPAARRFPAADNSGIVEVKKLLPGLELGITIPWISKHDSILNSKHTKIKQLRVSIPKNTSALDRNSTSDVSLRSKPHTLPRHTHAHVSCCVTICFNQTSGKGDWENIDHAQCWSNTVNTPHTSLKKKIDIKICNT